MTGPSSCKRAAARDACSCNVCKLRGNPQGYRKALALETPDLFAPKAPHPRNVPGQNLLLICKNDATDRVYSHVGGNAQTGINPNLAHGTNEASLVALQCEVAIARRFNPHTNLRNRNPFETAHYADMLHSPSTAGCQQCADCVIQQPSNNTSGSQENNHRDSSEFIEFSSKQ